MNKLFPTPYNKFEATVTYSNEDKNCVTIDIEGNEVEIEGISYEKDTVLSIQLPPDGLYIAGDGVGQLNDVFIESVIWKGEHNEIILESDERKWIMYSEQDEQVATYVPICFDFSRAIINPVVTDTEDKDEI